MEWYMSELIKSPLAPLVFESYRLCQKGEKLSPPFGKGRLGGILQGNFKQLNCYEI